MANVIKVKNSVTASNVPTGLVVGELAVNAADKKLYTSNAAGNATIELTNQGVNSFNTRTGTVTLTANDISSITYSGSTGGSTTAYTLTPSPAITSYVDGQLFLFKANATNTSSGSTFAVNGLAALPTTMGSVAMPVGGLLINNLYWGLVESSGTSFRITPYDAVSPVGDTISGPLVSISTMSATSFTGALIGNADTTTAANGIKTATTTVAVSSATAPTTGQVLMATSSTAATWQTPAGGGGADSRIASFPATPAAVPTVAGTSTTLQLAIGDSAVVAGNNNGTIAIGKSYSGKIGAIAIGIGNNTSSYGCPFGSNAISIGQLSLAYSADSIALGHNATCDANSTTGLAIGLSALSANNDALAIGNTATAASWNTIAIGNNVNAHNNNSIALGTNTYTDMGGELGFSTYGFSAVNDAKISNIIGRMTTSTATPTELGLQSTTANNTAPAGKITLTNNSTYIFDVDIVARKSATGTDYSAWNLKFLINREAAAVNTAIIGSPIKTLIGQTSGAVGWDVNVTADTTNGRPNISVTGQASTTIRWVANIRMTKVSG